MVSCLDVSSASCGDKGLHLNQTLAHIQTEELNPSKKSTNPAGSFWHLFSPSPTDSLYCASLANILYPHIKRKAAKCFGNQQITVGLAKAVHLLDANLNQICSIRPHYMRTHILFHSSEHLSCRCAPGDWKALGINVRKTDYIHCSYCICRLCTSQDRRSMPWCTLYPFILTAAKPFINQWAPGFPPTKRVAFLWGSEPPLFHRYPHRGKLPIYLREQGQRRIKIYWLFFSLWALFITLSNA